MDTGIYFDPVQLEVISVGGDRVLPKQRQWHRFSDDPSLRLTDVRRLLINRGQLEQYQAGHLHWFHEPPRLATRRSERRLAPASA